MWSSIHVLVSIIIQFKYTVVCTVQTNVSLTLHCTCMMGSLNVSGSGVGTAPEHNKQ